MLIKNKKILIITGSFGNGHLSVTNSIVNQFNQMNLSNLTLIQHDLFLEAHPVVTSALKKWYINSYKYFRSTYKAFYYSNPDEINKCFYKYYGLNRLINILSNEKPDLILLTFPTPVVSLLTQQLKLKIPIATVITDYNMHKNWITPGSQKYYVAAEHTKEQLTSIGIDAEDIQVTGIPIHPKFEVRRDRAAWLKSQGLDPNKKTLLMVAGAFGVVEGFSAMLSDLNKHDIQFVVVCGSSKKLQRELSVFDAEPNMKILGYTNDMDEWMNACDLMLTKPGGITISESLSQAIPLVFFNPAPGQEGENAVYFSRMGYARITHTVDETLHVLTSLLTDSRELAQMKNAMQAGYRAHSSEVICQDLVEMLNTSLLTQQLQSKASLYARIFAR
ncbi:diglucosyl diacylglycerol synthase [Macrococcus brunensis]|uniref:Diglucosyl diacylglycerol synthase n=1 Tax=Macrococcus brunensis TaxID=198483 RepID=A0A4R6BAQ1_9STAP|nr:diglucosyl diacylglycerol synthase [Macrococcus brunensis]TDL93374.1 diglucosyl diacylglycerol synthase [Macrococcus brunensis]ULG72664.1 diglucosyl diacylglycerol synthase [Macrococcus brunensis]ULG74918.1 diglucosyl diacylglycerol synthase [Macrococcus brunensis]